jgi:hypothetical protein
MDNSNIAAIYTEADLLFSKVGGKSCWASNNDLLNETAISPRFLHIKWLKQSVLLAYGDFTQTPSRLHQIF